MAPKGKVLEEFLSKIPQYKFKKVIFIDDRLLISSLRASAGCVAI